MQSDTRLEPEEDLNQAERAVAGWWYGLWPEAQRLVISIPVLIFIVWAVVNTGRSEDIADEGAPAPTTAPAAPATAQAAPSPDPALPFEERGAAFVASLDPTQVATWDQMAQCESSGDWSANTGNGYYGGLQFDPTTWAAYGGEGQPHEASREAQIMVAEQILAKQGWGAWPTCSAKLGLR